MCISIALTRLNSYSARTGGTSAQPALASINVLENFILEKTDKTSY